MNKQDIKNILFSVLFVSGEGISTASLSMLFDMEFEEFESIVNEIIYDCEVSGEGVMLVKFEDKLQLCTNRKYDTYIQRLLKPQITEKLSNSILETLSIIAYKQPVTRSDIENIRGVRCEYAISMLKEKGMIKEVGRKDVLGRPVLFGTTDDFLKHFDISSLSELPKIDFSKYEDDNEEVTLFAEEN